MHCTPFRLSLLRTLIEYQLRREAFPAMSLMVKLSMSDIVKESKTDSEFVHRAKFQLFSTRIAMHSLAILVGRP